MDSPDDQPISPDAALLPSTEKRRFERLKTVYWSMISSSLAILILSQLNHLPYLEADAPLIIGAFGASAVLLFACPHSPYAQPYNVIVGHLLCAVIGVSAFQLIGETNSMSMILAVSGGIALMQLTHSLHPPGGATALIAVIGSEQIHQLGYAYVLSPVGIGIGILITVAFITNNLSQKGKWPVTWLPFEK